MDVPPTASDESLALAAARGSRAAFEELVGRYGDRVLQVLEKRLQDRHAALDLLQEVWIKVFRALPRYRPGGSFRSWLFAIALNQLRDEKRRARRERVVYLEEFRDAAGDQADPSGRVEERAAIERALAGVPEPYRTALLLVDVQGFSYEEAARSLSCAVGTAKSRVHRGRAVFRDLYLRAGGDAGAEGSEERVRVPGGLS